MTLQLKQFLFIATTVCGLASCSCEEKKTGNDAGTSTPDADVDSGTQPVDPQIDWLTISAGSFTFGSPEGTPCRAAIMENEVPVTLTHQFQMAKYELTQKQWHALGFTVPPNVPVCDDCPVMYVNWYEALAWCNALSRFEGLEECYDLSSCTGEIGNGCPEGYGLCGDSIEVGNAYQCTGKTRKYASMYDCNGYRLPTGPEWEYTAKAGTTTNTYAGDLTTGSTSCIEEPILNDIAWYCYNTGYMDGPDPWSSVDFTFLQKVGLKQPNPWGLYDMLGNAREWVDYVGTGFPLDTNEGKPGESLTDPMGAIEENQTRRDLRGWFYGGVACLARASRQFDDSGGIRGPGYGFRPVRTLPATVGDAGVK